MKKQILKEYEHSVSSAIVSLANEVKEAIVDDMKDRVPKISKSIPLMFKEGKFGAAFDGENSFIKDIILSYTIYLAETEKEYLLAIQSHESELNSSFDEETRELKIVSCAINGELSEDFTEPVIHELTHMYQYAKGMNKREGLYERVSKLLDMGRTDIDAYYIGLSLYYTFPHEQDAFAHQYYMKHDMQMESFEPYATFKRAMEIVKNNYTNPRMQKAIEFLGYDSKSYLKRLHFGLKRFAKKLQNVNALLQKENSPNINIESHIKSMQPWMRLFEEAKGNIEFANESFLDFMHGRVIRITENELASIIEENVKKILTLK